MKKSSLILMIVGLSLAGAGLVCLVIAFWDKAMTLLFRERQRAKEFADYADLDDYDD